MHDTPSKAYFDREQRAFSWLYPLARPRDLAIEILKDDKKLDRRKNRYRHE
jgi:murein L,D-transpeptidase YcbB/YkuD